MMLVFADGSQAGTLGGGCVEAEVKRRAFELPFVERRPSGISVPGAEALVLPHAHACGPREAFMIGREFAHVHPGYDGSSHLMLPLPVVEEPPELTELPVHTNVRGPHYYH